MCDAVLFRPNRLPTAADYKDMSDCKECSNLSTIMSSSIVLFNLVQGDTNTTPLRSGTDNFHVSGDGYNSTRLSSELSGPTLSTSAWLYVFFRGSKLSLGLSYRAQSLPTEWSFWMDGHDFNLTTSSVPSGDSAGSTLTARYLIKIQSSAANQSTDHQLVAYIPATKDRPLQIEPGVDNNAQDTIPATFGMSAKDVQADNAIDNTSPSLIYSSGWSHSTGSFWDLLCWNETSSKTNEAGAWVETTFAGTDIWFFGYIGIDGVHLNVSITEYTGDQKRAWSKEHFIKGDAGMKVPLVQSPLFNETNIPANLARTYRITVISGSIALDFVRFQGTVVDVPAQRQHPRMNLILIATLGAIGAFMLGVLSLLFLKRRRPRKEQLVGRNIGPDAPTIRSFYAASTNTAVSGRLHRKRTEDDHVEWARFSGPSRSTQRSSTGIHSEIDDSLQSSHLTLESQTMHSSEPLRSSISSFGVNGRRVAVESSGSEGLQLSMDDLARVIQRVKELENLANLGKLSSGGQPEEKTDSLNSSLGG